MKKIIFSIIIVLLFIFLFPFRTQMRDGGTVHYNAILYDVYKVNRINPDIEADKNITGTVIEILGFEVYNSTDPRIDIHK